MPARASLPAVAIALTCALLAPMATSCLPGDTRPVPASVYVTAEPSEALTLGFETSDGWTIGFERVLLAIGNVDFESDDAACNSYAEAHYDRLFDFTVAGREKVGTVYGLGTCRMDFRLRDPSFEALLGPGATASDVTFMRTRGTDRFADDERASVVLRGTATREQETKRFDWVFRRSYELGSCAAEKGFSTTVELTERAASELRIEVRPQELFRPLADDHADLLFQPMADADVDGDGAVTLEELSAAPYPDVDPGPLGALDASPRTLESLIYLELLPRILRVAGGGPCEAEDRSRR